MLARVDDRGAGVAALEVQARGCDDADALLERGESPGGLRRCGLEPRADLRFELRARAVTLIVEAETLRFACVGWYLALDRAERHGTARRAGQGTRGAHCSDRP